MAERISLDPSSWATYRSRFRVRAQRIAPEGATIGSPVRFMDDAGKAMSGKVGDYLVELEDGRLEFWTPDRFERELEIQEVQAIDLELRR